MAAGDIDFYNNYKFAVLDGDAGGTPLSGMPVVYDTDVIKVIVMANTFTPDRLTSTTQEHLDDIIADEVTTGTAYTGPITIANDTVTESAGTITYDGDDIVISQDGGGGFTDGRYLVFYKVGGTDATSPLICVGDLGEDKGNVSGDLTFQWGAGGIFTLA